MSATLYIYSKTTSNQHFIPTCQWVLVVIMSLVAAE